MTQVAKGRRVGENHQHAILTNGEVEMVRRCREDGMTYAMLVMKFEVSKSSIAAICTYRRR